MSSEIARRLVIAAALASLLLMRGHPDLPERSMLILRETETPASLYARIWAQEHGWQCWILDPDQPPPSGWVSVARKMCGDPPWIIARGSRSWHSGPLPEMEQALRDLLAGL